MSTNRITSKTLVLKVCFFVLIAVSLIGPPVWAGKGDFSASTTLSEIEAEMLTFMREEEKLARDVYLEMHENWEVAIFSTIAASEQKHMDAMEKKIIKYGLPDPVLPALGQFTNEDLQEKYNELVYAGSLSLVDALYVGATIEEIDMVDIQHAIDVTSQLDIVNAYQNLLEGSKNHLRAYVRALDAQGFTYAPQYLSQSLYDAIINL